MLETKRCSKCLLTKDVSCFHRSGSRYVSQCKECRRKYYEDNKEKESERKRKYYAENKQAISVKAKKYREENKQAISVKAKKYREENKEKESERVRNHYQRNKSSYRARDAIRRADMLAATPDDADLKIIRLIYENCPDGYEVDHIVPIDRGGLHHQDNLAYLPMSINRSKGTKLVEEFPEFHEHVIYPKLEELYGRTT